MYIRLGIRNHLATNLRVGGTQGWSIPHSHQRTPDFKGSLKGDAHTWLGMQGSPRELIQLTRDPMGQIIQWKQFESILTLKPFILWLLTEPPDTWELGVSWGLCQICVHFIEGKPRRKSAVTFVPGIVLSAVDPCFMHNSKEFLSHCVL